MKSSNESNHPAAISLQLTKEEN